MAHEREECGDTESFVAIADYLEVDRVVVEEDAEPCDERVNGYHEENANDTDETKTHVSNV